MILFTHIEKCAGTSFNEILSLTYPRYIHITKNKFGGNEKRNDLTHNQYKKIVYYFPSVIGGHCIRPYLEFLPARRRITFLREPKERYLSQYNHMFESGWARSIEEFLNKDFYYNFITKKIAGSNDYQYAKILLKDFVFIGDANNYIKSLNYLQDVLEVKLIGKIAEKNQRKNNKNYLKYSDLSNRQKLKVEENNKYDLKLYEEFILQNDNLRYYSESIKLKIPSKTRVKLISKLNKIKKNKIVNPIRMGN